MKRFYLLLPESGDGDKVLRKKFKMIVQKELEGIHRDPGN